YARGHRGCGWSHEFRDTAAPDDGSHPSHGRHRVRSARSRRWHRRRPRSRRSARALRALPQLRLGSRGSRVTAPPGYGGVAVTPHFRCTTCQRPETAWGVQCVGCFAFNTLRPIALTGPGGTADAMDADMATPQSHKTRQAISVVL